MPIYQLDPNAANRQQLQFFMSQIALFAMQRAQQKARLEELEKQTAAQEKLFGLKLEAEGLARQPRGARTREVELAGQGEPTTTTGTVTVREPAEKPTTVLGGRPLVITPRKDYQQFLSVEDGRLVIRSIPKGEPGQGLPVGESWLKVCWVMTIVVGQNLTSVLQLTHF